VSQLRESAARFLEAAKSLGVPIFLVGHVTKEGAIAGPRVLEHMVDAVLYLEGDRFHAYRILRATKDRFGSTDEVGVFEMGDAGLSEVRNPSQVFLEERSAAAGSVVVPTLEGTRPLLVEVQALVSPTAFGLPRRTVSGVDMNRTLVLLAVLAKRAGIGLGAHDVYVSLAGGLRVREPAADLGVAVAVASAYRDRAPQSGTVLIGEVGLSGEVRRVSRLAARLLEARSLGFTRAVVPKASLADAPSDGLTVEGVATVREALAKIALSE
jgi:DNA repair protein RadA/Sms